MTLYFDNGYEPRRPIGHPSTKESAYQLVYKFLEEHNYKAPIQENGQMISMRLGLMLEVTQNSLFGANLSRLFGTRLLRDRKENISQKRRIK